MLRHVVAFSSLAHPLPSQLRRGKGALRIQSILKKETV
jgi:hypothetical protein